MEIFPSIINLKNFIIKNKEIKNKIGFVPTMGYLHEGHLSLIEESKKNCNITVVSIYVNPTQFNNPEDFENYPKNIENDSKLLRQAGVNALFLPTTQEIYPRGRNNIEIKIPSLFRNLCAKGRPGHFEGVLQIVSKLFHIVEPDIAFFGLKDYQQYLIIQKMVEELNFPIKIVGVETKRENSGLAMSSRNTRLSQKELDDASLIYRALKIAEESSKKKSSTPKSILTLIREVLLTSPGLTIEYIEILDPQTLEEKLILEGEILIGVAVTLGKVRLIDNLRFRLVD